MTRGEHEVHQIIAALREAPYRVLLCGTPRDSRGPEIRLSSEKEKELAKRILGPLVGPPTLPQIVYRRFFGAA
jgi:hypothetical protein